MIDQLVEQGIRLRRNTNGDVVLLRHENRRDQIRHRLSNAGACLDYEILGSFEGRTNFLSHRELLFTGLKIVIELSHDSRRGERLRQCPPLSDTPSTEPSSHRYAASAHTKSCFRDGVP